MKETKGWKKKVTSKYAFDYALALNLPLSDSLVPQEGMLTLGDGVYKILISTMSM